MISIAIYDADSLEDVAVVDGEVVPRAGEYVEVIDRIRNQRFKLRVRDVGYQASINAARSRMTSANLYCEVLERAKL